MATRLHDPVKAYPNWDRLMTLALVRAQQVGDPRYQSLQRACTNGQSQEILRRYGVISEKDIEREFPSK